MALLQTLRWPIDLRLLSFDLFATDARPKERCMQAPEPASNHSNGVRTIGA